MSYVLGLIAADGAVEDVRKSSRTCYLAIASKDKKLLSQVKKVMNSTHRLYLRKQRMQTFGLSRYLCADTHVLRIGSKVIFQDLINLGITPRKSLRLRLPKMDLKYFKFFLRGYFDGDGCVCVFSPKKGHRETIAVAFTSGCKSFLENLSHKISNKVGVPIKKIYRSGGAFRLFFKQKHSLLILKYMYSNLKSAPFLERKFEKYQNYLNLYN